MRRAPLGLLLVGLLAVASAAAADFAASDPAASTVVERRWPGSLDLIGRRLAEKPDEISRTQPVVDAALRSAAAFAGAEAGAGAAAAKEESVRSFRAALAALGRSRSRFLGGSGGLGAIARSVLGDGEFLAQLDALKKIGLEPPDDAALREASARSLQTFYKGRFEDGRVGSGLNGPASAAPARRRVATAAAPKPLTPDGAAPPPVSAAAPNEAAASAQSLELRRAALAALQAAAAAVPLPASALSPAVDRLMARVSRDAKLLGASSATVEWLGASKDPKARALLQSFLQAAALPDAARRAALAEALVQASELMDRSQEGREDARIRAVLLAPDGAAPEARSEAARALLALRAADPGYFKAKASGLDFVRFNREHLADFPAGTRFSGFELGLPPPGSGAASVEYEVTPDGRLAPARVVSSDGSARERGEAAGAWTIRDRSGRTTGWSLDAGSFLGIADSKARTEAVVAAARWLAAQGFKPGGRNGMADALASLLRDALEHPEPGVKALRIYADREMGLLSIESRLERGVKQRTARLESAANGLAEGLALFERTVADPSDASTPSRKAMVYRGADQRELLTEEIVSNGASKKRVYAGTIVESIPIAVRYRRNAEGRWERDGRTREFLEQRRVIHDSAGVIGGAAEVLGATGRGVTDLTGSALAASMALNLYPDRVLSGGALVAELQDDWFARAKTNFADNAFLSTAGNYYAPGAYRELKGALGVDDGKYVQNVRKELTDQGHPLLGAVAGAGVDVANGMVPMAAGLGAINAISPLGLAGEAASTGVNYVWTAQAAWGAGVSVKDFVRARRGYNGSDPASVADYYSAIENLGAQAGSVPVLMYGLHEAMQAHAKPVQAKGAAAATEVKPVVVKMADPVVVDSPPKDLTPDPPAVFKDQKVLTSRKTGKGTVLGPSPRYVVLAEDMGSRYFQIPIDVWEKMTRDQQWEANLRFLKRVIARQEPIHLAVSIEGILKRPDTFLYQEVMYLRANGYEVGGSGLMLFPKVK